MLCPVCKKGDKLAYKPWLGEMWECKNCNYRGPLIIEDLEPVLWKLLIKIPKGKVTTYGILAKKLGISSRQVGRLLKQNPHAPKVPCHRVVRSDGSMGGYTHKGRFSPKRKILLLRKEGIEVRGKKINLKKYLYRF